MIYLFNKIHLKPLALFDNQNKISRIILTDEVDNISEISEVNLIQLTHGDIYFKEHNYADLLSKFFNGSDSEFVSFLSCLRPDVRLEIYMNNDDLMSFLMTWYKTFLPNISPSTTYMVFKLVYARASNIIGFPYTTQAHFVERDARVCKALADSMVDKETFVQRWNAAETLQLQDAVFEDIRRSLAIEFQIPTITRLDDYVYAEENKNKVALMGKKWHMSMLGDLKHMALRQLSLLPDFDVQKDIVQDWVLRHPEYSFLDDDDFIEDNVNTIYATYDMEVVKQAYIDQMKRFDYINVERIVKEFHFFKTDLSYYDVMNTELASTYDRHILNRWEYNNTINVYLLDVVLNAIRADDKQLLRELSVVRG